MFPEITVTQLSEKLKSEDKFILLDVRELSELNYAKLEDSRLKVTPMSRLAREGTAALPESAKSQGGHLCIVSSREPQYAGHCLACPTGMEERLQRARMGSTSTPAGWTNQWDFIKTVVAQHAVPLLLLFPEHELPILIEQLAVHKDLRIRAHIADHVPVDGGSCSCEPVSG
jgi:hypothetical protein